MSTGILLSEMPRMMQDVVVNLLEGTPELHVVAHDVPVGDLVTSIERERPGLVVLWSDTDESSPLCAELLSRFPQLAVVALERGGQHASTYMKRPRRVRLEAISRSQLVAAIQRAARRVRADQDERDVLLRQAYDAVHEPLEYTRGGCVEFELKVFWQNDRLSAEILEESEDVPAMRDGIAMLADDDGAPTISLSQRIRTEVERRTDHELERLLDVLEPIALEVLVSPNVTETMLMNASVLVERTQETEFYAAVRALADAHAGRLIVTCDQPAPAGIERTSLDLVAAPREARDGTTGPTLTPGRN